VLVWIFSQSKTSELSCVIYHIGKIGEITRQSVRKNIGHHTLSGEDGS